MSDLALPLRAEDVQSDRRARILDAAERCFVRSGFHRTTMQDVAVEAGMSPGNLYRYFPSKDALVMGLAERDRAEVGEDFRILITASDFVTAFASMARKHFHDEPRERAILCLEIWAEATRNPAVAAMGAEFDREIIGRMADLFGAAQAQGQIPAHVDPRSVALLTATLANGLFVRRAISNDFEGEREIANVMAVIEALLGGAIALPSPGRTIHGVSS